MKFVILGLGNFGASLGKRLMEEGHEVVGVDHTESKINLFKDDFTYVIQADTADEQNIMSLPIEEADYVFIAIGEDVGSSITTLALIKKHYTTPIIARAINEIHYTVIESIGVQEIIQPESDYATQFSHRFLLKDSLLTIPLDDEYEIAEIKVPTSYVGKTLVETNMINLQEIRLVAILREEGRRNLIGNVVNKRRVLLDANMKTILYENDAIVVFGPIKKLKGCFKSN
jgi:trk system potassium uptake protein TrkA